MEIRKKKSMIYKRIFATYIITIIFLIVSLDTYFIKKELSNIKNNSIYINEKVTYDVNEEINKINNNTSIIVKNIYNDKYIINDILDFLNMDSLEYLKYKLDRFSSADNSFYNGIESFTRNSFNLNESLTNISFISNTRNEISTFNRDNQIKVQNKKVDDLDKISEGYNFTSIIAGKNTISYIREIRNPVTLKSEGEIICTYNLKDFKNIVKKYEDGHEVMILDWDGYVVFDSTGKYDYEKHPNFFKIMESGEEVKLDENYYISKAINTSTLITIVKTHKENIGNLSDGMFSSLFFIDIFLFLIVQCILYIKLKKLSDRTDDLLLAMEKVKGGDLDISIPITNDNDEINYISENFNEMCETLKEYIEKSYLAEINQKGAEMVALQNQINPHFLYNTLESIRMKAICNGDKEVGKMLYTLAFLFRKQVKEKNIITIKSELEYCQKYLEIFKFRYDEKFEYIVDCDEGLLDKQIIKFTLQPLIENYFVHGISLENYDNRLSIEIRNKNEDLIICIKDNGSGASKEKVKNLNDMLEDNINLGESIGLVNANERIKLTYGKKYGIKLFNNKDKGIMVVVKLPCKEVDSYV